MELKVEFYPYVYDLDFANLIILDGIERTGRNNTHNCFPPLIILDGIESVIKHTLSLFTLYLTSLSLIFSLQSFRSKVPLDPK